MRLVVVLCNPSLAADPNKVTWDTENQEIVTAVEKDINDRLAAFEKVDFYIDIEKLRVSTQKKNKKEYSAPEALFNLDDGHLVNIFHIKNNAKRAVAQKAADRNDSEEEGLADSASKPRNVGKLSSNLAPDIEGGDGSKTITWLPPSSSDECLASCWAAGGR
jgi:hypothetical protein